MQYVNLGKSGLKVSRLCLGMMSYGDKSDREWFLQEKDALPFVKRALDTGINFFDTADMYSAGKSEEITGNALKKLGVHREGVVIATKVYFPMGEGPNERGLSRKHILASIDSSLRRLQLDYVDLYQIHRWDPETSIEETLDALNDVVSAGKARYIGASSMFAWQFSKALYTSDLQGSRRFISMQNHYNLIYREEEREMIPLCLDQQIGLIPWSPLARGFLAGNHRKADWGETVRAKTDQYGQSLYYQDQDFRVAERVQEIARERTASPSQIALAWLLNKPHIAAPIIGATRLEHLDQAFGALEIQLSQEEVRRLEEPYELHPVLGHS